MADFPIKRFDFGLVGQIEQAEGEHVVGFFAPFRGVVKGLQHVEAGQVFSDVQQIAHQCVLLLAIFNGGASPDFFDGAKSFNNKNAVVGDDGPTAFTDDLRVRHLLLVAYFADEKHHVIGIFLQGVVGRAVGSRPAAVIINTQAPSDIDGLDCKTHFVKLGVKPGRFLHGLFDRQNIRHLRTDVEMKQLETMLHFFRAQNFGGGEKFGGVQAEFGIFPSALGPFAGAFAEQAGADPDQRLDSHLPRDRNDLLQLLQFLHHHDDFFAKLDAHEGHADEQSVFVTVANDEGCLLILQGQPGEKFRFAADLQPELMRFASVQNFLHHFAELVDLDGENAAIFILIIEFGNGRGKGLVDRLHPVPQNVLEPDEDRKFQAATLRLLNDVGDIDHRAVLAQGHGDDVSGIIDVEVLRPPTVDVVKGARGLDVPGRDWRGNLAHFCLKAMGTI